MTCTPMHAQLVPALPAHMPVRLMTIQTGFSEHFQQDFWARISYRNDNVEFCRTLGPIVFDVPLETLETSAILD